MYFLLLKEITVITHRNSKICNVHAIYYSNCLWDSCHHILVHYSDTGVLASTLLRYPGYSTCYQTIHGIWDTRYHATKGYFVIPVVYALEILP
jgi:hypothetical protein